MPSDPRRTTRAPPVGHVLVVAAGGAAGGLARWLVGVVLPDPAGFPWPTFAVNVAGAGLLALLPALTVLLRHPLLPPLLGTGVLGGFTTLSATSEQARTLLAQARPGLAAVYVLGTLAAALVAVALADRASTAAARRTFADEEGDW